MPTDTAMILLAPSGPGLGGAVAPECFRLQKVLGFDVKVMSADILDDSPEMGAVWTEVIEIHGRLDNLEAAVSGMAERIGATVNAAASAIVVGDDRVIFEKPVAADIRPVKLYYALFRVPTHEPERFSKEWYEGHVEYVKESSYVINYHQLHCDAARTGTCSTLAGFGVSDIAGVAHELFRSRDQLVAALEDDTLDDERADVGAFSDASRNRGILTRIVE